MKAIRIHGPRDARYEEIPEPKPGPDDVLVKVKAVAICGTDVELFEGTMFYITSGMTKYPFIPGHEWSGEVVETGANVTAFRPGDAVVGECSIGCRKCKRCLKGSYNLCVNRRETGLLGQPGGMAELISYPQHFLHKVEGLSFEQAAFIEPTGIAVNPARKTRITPADRVAVIGPGPIGLFAVQVARAYGARQIILVGDSDFRLQAGLELGADAVVDFRKGDVGERVRDLTNGEMVDAVIEAVGRKSVWPTIASVVAPGARVAMTGLFAGEICDVNFDPLVVQEISVQGSLGAPGMWPECISLHQRGLIRTDRIITHRLALADFAEAIEISRSRREGVIKVLLTP
ncbi:MAG: alcohol dehydrogenase catalytic domain-containing protein [Planctomycetes bacterium]|nr:alcohol dehydrogenase catalytic domain-containing protein [Planctomycetota bacterium]